MKKINFKQMKYVLPGILYPLLLITGYFIIGMFTTEVKKVDKNLMATEYLNSELPEANIDDNLGSKRENMVNSFGDAKDYTAVENAEKDSVKGKEDYESRYNRREADAIERNNEELDRIRQMQRRLRNANQPKMGNDDFVVPLSEKTDRMPVGFVVVKDVVKRMICLLRFGHMAVQLLEPLMPMKRNKMGIPPKVLEYHLPQMLIQSQRLRLS